MRSSFQWVWMQSSWVLLHAHYHEAVPNTSGPTFAGILPIGLQHLTYSPVSALLLQPAELLCPEYGRRLKQGLTSFEEERDPRAWSRPRVVYPQSFQSRGSVKSDADHFCGSPEKEDFEWRAEYRGGVTIYSHYRSTPVIQSSLHIPPGRAGQRALCLA